ncbi:MAG: ISL3 family transposase [Nostocaceae cyanobacterium]|nr:ISL3 family transposase [Nostocaceae cyanobacterium]
MKFPVEQILNLPGMKVLGCEEVEGMGLVIEIETDMRCSTCPKCGQISRSIHQNHWRIIQDLAWSTLPVLLKINRRQYLCKKCQKPFSEELNFVDKKRGYTKRFAAYITKQVKIGNIHSVAERNDLSDEEVASMLESQASSIIQIDLSQVKRIGIDEIALVKGQGNYLAVIVDLDTHKLIEIVKSRRQEDLREVLKEWGSEVLDQITEVSIDLWSPYKRLIEELMINADITADRFHVMKQVNDELDYSRKTQKKEANTIKNKSEKKRVLAGLTKSKYVLLKNEDSLNKIEKEKLKSVQEVSLALATMHEMKEKFRNIFEANEPWGERVIMLLDWMHNSMKYFPKSIGTISRWFEEVVGYFNNGTSSGVVEGINNKLKLIKRLGYGFRNFENFRLRSLLSWHFSIN